MRDRICILRGTHSNKSLVFFLSCEQKLSVWNKINKKGMCHNNTDNPSASMVLWYEDLCKVSSLCGLLFQRVKFTPLNAKIKKFLTIIMFYKFHYPKIIKWVKICFTLKLGRHCIMCTISKDRTCSFREIDYSATQLARYKKTLILAPTGGICH